MVINLAVTYQMGGQNHFDGVEKPASILLEEQHIGSGFIKC